MTGTSTMFMTFMLVMTTFSLGIGVANEIVIRGWVANNPSITPTVVVAEGGVLISTAGNTEEDLSFSGFQLRGLGMFDTLMRTVGVVLSPASTIKSIFDAIFGTSAIFPTSVATAIDTIVQLLYALFGIGIILGQRFRG